MSDKRRAEVRYLTRDAREPTSVEVYDVPEEGDSAFSPPEGALAFRFFDREDPFIIPGLALLSMHATFTRVTGWTFLQGEEMTLPAAQVSGHITQRVATYLEQKGVNRVVVIGHPKIGPQVFPLGPLDRVAVPTSPRRPPLAETSVIAAVTAVLKK